MNISTSLNSRNLQANIVAGGLIIVCSAAIVSVRYVSELVFWAILACVVYWRLWFFKKSGFVLLRWSLGSATGGCLLGGILAFATALLGVESMLVWLGLMYWGACFGLLAGFFIGYIKHRKEARLRVEDLEQKG